MARTITVQQLVMMAVVVIASAMIRRWIGATSPHSGYQTPPMYGDFEAQRHWIEITSHLKLSEWYVDGPRNNLTYWGLDYPPLTAYHSLVLGLVAQGLLSSDVFNHSFGLVVSHGSETPETIQFMRESVLWSEILVFFPAAIAVSFLITIELDPLQWVRSRGASPRRGILISTLNTILNASIPMLLIDHGHFQYNSVSLGLMLWAIYHAVKHVGQFERVRVLKLSMTRHARLSLLTHLLWSIVFAALSMSFKQMSLYYALGLGPWYLGECVRYAQWRYDVYLEERSKKSDDGTMKKHVSTLELRSTFYGALVFSIACCAIVGLCTFGVVLSPFYWSGTLQNVFTRVFPVGRGLYEDKVANFWCVVSPVLKLTSVAQRLAPHGGIAVHRSVVLLCCLASTILGSLPSAVAAVKSALAKKVDVNGKQKKQPADSDGSPYADVWEETQGAVVHTQKRMEQLLWMMICSSLSFYLFSFQVHEKSILLSLLPAVVLLALLQRTSETAEQVSEGAILQPMREEFAKEPNNLASIHNKRALLWMLIFFAHASLFQLAEKDKNTPVFVLGLVGLGVKTVSVCRTLASTVGGARWWPNSYRVYQILVLVIPTMEVVRVTTLEGNERYPHLGILARFSMCAAVFCYTLVSGSMFALSR